MSLKEYTIKLARDSGKPSHELATLSGTTDSWVRMLLGGKIARPNVDYIEALYTGLTGRKLVDGE